MQIREIVDPLLEKQVWARSGKKVVRKYRCASGRRRGKVVAKPQQCYAPLNLKASITLKKTKSRKGSQMARKAKRTKRTNASSRAVQRLNRK